MARRTRSRANAGVLKLATEARGWFTFSGDAPENGQRPNIWTRRDGYPEWVGEMIETVHDGMIADDNRYAMIVEALDAIVESRGDEDEAYDTMPHDLPVATHEILEWLASHPRRLGYCDDAQSEGLCQGDDVTLLSRIEAGMLVERREVLAAVYRVLETRHDEAD